MDTMKILLGATVALLIGALAMSWNGMKQGVATAPGEEQLRIKQQIEELNLEVQRLKTEKAVQELRIPTASQSAPAPAPSSADLEEAKAQLAAKEAQLKALEDEKNKAERKARLYKDEAGEVGSQILESHDQELRRARQISQALVMAVVTEYQEDPALGGVVVIDVKMPEQVQVGSILGIRKNTGILGQVKVTSISPEGAIASPLAGFGQLKPQPGDELIVPPQL
ncbi:hypothetical protein [Luteolibacter sp. LG18]|uniref:hypothetical protein n=1 Tax=Luteolibacter sp. LG18 TaxID=2819286 RepID=UPI002B2E50E9|nr:hypothetical protein llg_08080 [Luteolibacter sp. LG18]